MTTAMDRAGRPHSPAGERRLAGRPLGVAALLVLTVGCQEPSRLATRQDGSSGAAEVTVPGLPNFGKVCHGLYRGGQPTAAGYEALRSRGIRTIVSLRTFDGGSEDLQEAGFRTYHISFKTAHPETEDVLEFLSIATIPDNRPLFVHCRRGADRTGMMVAVYRMVVEDWPRPEAIREMRGMGFSVWNVAIERYLRNLDVAALKRELAGRAADDRLISHQRTPS